MAASKHTLPPKLWEHPDPKSTNAWKFMQDVNSKYGLDMKNWDDLHGWSVKSNSAFWEEVFKRYVIIAQTRTGQKYHRSNHQKDTP
jgi:acetoacetyl-CoA synthetase